MKCVFSELSYEIAGSRSTKVVAQVAESTEGKGAGAGGFGGYDRR
jgi:hypothetical protein